MTKDDKKSFRATFSDVKSSQQKLLEWIENLIEENRPLEPEKRQMFLRLLANATLGEGNKLEIGSRHKGAYRNHDWRADGEGSTVDIQNYGDLIRFAIYEEDDEIAGEPISKLWKKIRGCILRIIPFALETAIQSSAERIPKTKQEPTKEW